MLVEQVITVLLTSCLYLLSKNEKMLHLSQTTGWLLGTCIPDANFFFFFPIILPKLEAEFICIYKYKYKNLKSETFKSLLLCFQYHFNVRMFSNTRRTHSGSPLTPLLPNILIRSSKSPIHIHCPVLVLLPLLNELLDAIRHSKDVKVKPQYRGFQNCSQPC